MPDRRQGIELTFDGLYCLLGLYNPMLGTPKYFQALKQIYYTEGVDFFGDVKPMMTVNELLQRSELSREEATWLYAELGNYSMIRREAVEPDNGSDQNDDKCPKVINRASLLLICKKFGSNSSSADAHLAWLTIYMDTHGIKELPLSEAEKLTGIKRANLLKKRKTFDLKIEGNLLRTSEKTLETAKILVLWELASSFTVYMHLQTRDSQVKIAPIHVLPDSFLIPLPSLDKATSPEQVAQIIDQSQNFLGDYAKKIGMKDPGTIRWFSFTLESIKRPLLRSAAPNREDFVQKYHTGYLVRTKKNLGAYIDFLSYMENLESGPAEKYEFLYWMYWHGLAHEIEQWGSSKRPVYFEKYVREYLERSELWEKVEKELGIMQRDLTSFQRSVGLALNVLSEHQIPMMKMPSISWELEPEFETIRQLVKIGQFAAVYRELRRIIEDMVWGIVNDLIIINTKDEYMETLESNPYPLPFMYPSIPWYRLSEKSKLKALKKECSGESSGLLNYPLIEAILLPDPGNELKYYESKEHPYLSELMNMGEPIGVMPIVNISNLNHVLEQMKHERDDECLQAMSDRIKKYVDLGIEYALPRYPTEEFMLDLMDSLLGGASSLKQLYDEYSRFIHAYDSTRSSIPFSSVAEAAVIAGELHKFQLALKQVTNTYVAHVRPKQ